MSRAIRFDDRAMSVFQWIDSISDTEAQFIDEVYITRGAMARRYNLSRQHATRLLRRMVAEGMLIEIHDPQRIGSQYRYFLSVSACEELAAKRKISWRWAVQ